MAEIERKTGTVVWFEDKVGYGFLAPDDWQKGVQVFVHYSQIHSRDKFKTLKEGQRVEFSIGKREGTNKPQAEAVVVIAEAPEKEGNNHGLVGTEL